MKIDKKLNSFTLFAGFVILTVLRAMCSKAPDPSGVPCMYSTNQ